MPDPKLSAAAKKKKEAAKALKLKQLANKKKVVKKKTSPIKLQKGVATDKQKKEIAFKKKAAQRLKDYGPRLKEPFKNNNYDIKSDSITNRYQIAGKTKAKEIKELNKKVRNKKQKEALLKLKGKSKNKVTTKPITAAEKKKAQKYKMLQKKK